MSETLGSLLDDARRRNFVGRSAEIASFEGALSGHQAHRVLFVYGPGGIGKTALLQRYRARAAECGRSVIQLDGRDHAVTRATPLQKQQLKPPRVEPRPVLLVDGYELLEPLDDAFRCEFLPSLPADAVTVLAGRHGPAPVWRSDPGWRSLIAVHELSHFDTDEGTELLLRAGVAPELHQRLLGLARGHPLALALLADAALMDRVPDDLVDAPIIVDALLPVFVDNVPDEAHGLGLEVCAHSWVTTEGMLTHLLGNDARRVWQWLESLPFVVRSPLGLYPHDLARDVLEAEHQRRSPASRVRVHRLLHSHARQTVRGRSPAEAHLAALQLLYLHKASPLTRSLWEVRHSEAVSVLPGRVTDHAVVIELVERVEGAQAAELARRWLEAQGQALRVLRRGREVSAFAFEPVLPADSTLEADDVVTRAILAEVASRSPLRAGEQVSIGRFFGSRDGCQTDPFAVLCGAVGSLSTWLTQPLAWSWIVTVAPEFWAPIFDYLGFDQRLEIAGDRPGVAFGFDWRRIGVEAWMEVMSERELSGESGPMPQALLRPAPLDRPAFEQAVRDGLRKLYEPAELARNPLLESRLVSRPAASPDELARALREAVQLVGANPGAHDLQRVLDRTFVHPAPSQEAAAEILDLSFSTYRRRLGKAIDAVVDLLWAVEIGERPLLGDREIDRVTRD